MPKEPVAKVIKAALPTATYSTRGQVQGPGGNKTQQYLAALDPQDPGQQGFYREALSVPHPMQAGQRMSYGQLQDLLAGPHKAAALDAYASANRLTSVSAAQMQQTLFDAGKADLLQRGAANPGVLAFPPAADAARRAPNTATALAHGNFATPANGAVQDAVALQQRYADQPADGAVMAAPGMPVRLVRGAPVATPARTILGSIAAR